MRASESPVIRKATTVLFAITLIVAAVIIDGVVLRYGYLYGPDTWYEVPPKPPSVHVDAAACAALLAVGKGAGIYNIADHDGAVSVAKAKRELGFDPAFRLP